MCIRKSNVPSVQCQRPDIQCGSSAEIWTRIQYEVRPRKDKRGADLISDAWPFGRLWYCKVSDAIGYAKFYSRSQDAVIRVYDDAGNVIETHDSGQFSDPAPSTPRHQL